MNNLGTIDLYSPGRLKDYLKDGLISMATVFVDAGKAWLTAKIDESLQTTGDFIGWGTGAGTAAAADTTLFTEAAESRTTATRTRVTTTVTNDTVQWVGTITSLSGQTITNAGNLTASTVGTLIVKGDFTGVALLTGDQIQFTIKLKIA